LRGISISFFECGNVQLGELLSHGRARVAAPFMSACVIVTQLVISFSAAWTGRRASTAARKPFLLVEFGVLPIRGLLYTLTQSVPLLIAIQFLDGVANSIFGVVSMLVVLDRTRRTGRFNLVQGALSTTVGIGAALSNVMGGELIKRSGYDTSFLGLAAIAVVAFLIILFAVPETLDGQAGEPRHAEQLQHAEGQLPG
jgi:MFS family permease